jgi:hypothetical protein
VSGAFKFLVFVPLVEFLLDIGAGIVAFTRASSAP